MTTGESTTPARPDALDALRALVARHLADAESAWSLGTFGAVAEFARDPREEVTLDGLCAVTRRGAIAIAVPPDVVPVVSDRTTAAGTAHGIAFCLPRERARGSGRRTLTEIGLDRDALREDDRDAVLFDLGLDTAQCDCLVRVGEPRCVARLRALCGTALLVSGPALFGELVAMNPHRVFISPLGRIEVYQDIPAADGRSPEGPHTHVLPRLLGERRTHAASLPVPEGLVPCLELHTRHPVGAALSRAIDR